MTPTTFIPTFNTFDFTYCVPVLFFTYILVFSISFSISLAFFKLSFSDFQLIEKLHESQLAQFQSILCLIFATSHSAGQYFNLRLTN